MRKIKRFASTALAVALVGAMPMTAFATSNVAEGENPPAQVEEQDPDGSQGAGSGLSTGNMTVDESITVRGLQEGDSLTFYKVLAWDNGWVAAPGFENALSAEEFDQLAKGGSKVNEDGTESATAGGISFEMAGKLGAAVSGASPVYDGQLAADGAVVISGPEAGLYMAIIVPGQPGYTYNPVFVAADFSRANNNGSLDLSNGALGYADKGTAKVNKIGLEKEADSITSDVGDTVQFTVKTAIPLYASNYVNPVFRLTDVLSAGLTLDAGSIAVKVGEAAVDEANYTVTTTEDGYVLDFSAAYLKSLGSVTEIIVTYTAKVTDEATTSVNPEDNTVTVNFSNRPDDETGFGILRDRTNHYTFDIDGTLFGDSEYTASEVIKVGVDANGNEITDRVTLDNGKWAGALQGAKFTLYSNEECTSVYKNDIFDGNEIVSGENGHIAIKGLDAGEYWLLETEAPAGYIKAQDPVHIKITAVTEEVEVEDTENVDGKDVKVTYMVDVLKSYTVEVNGVTTASYQMVNKGADLEEVNKGDIVGDESMDGKIVNTVGVELPSTGGIGTTIFYVVGATLVIGAGVVLVAKKRMKGGSED